MLNFWASQEYPFAGWRGKFPLEAGLSNLERQLAFLVKVHEVAEQESVRQAIEPPREHSKYLENSDSRYTHVQYLRAYYTQTGEVSHGLSPSTTRLCYYNLEGDLVEGDIEDTGELLKILHPDKERSRFMSYEDPVRLIVTPERVSSLGKVNTLLAEDTDVGEERTIDVSIQLNSDIWFPWVAGFLEERRTHGSNNDKYDNRELAQCHTPPLNRFISTVRELVLEYGGIWRIDYPDPFIGFYAPMITEQGILLDGMPKDMSLV
jgi:hypothetical protein